MVGNFIRTIVVYIYIYIQYIQSMKLLNKLRRVCNKAKDLKTKLWNTLESNEQSHNLIVVCKKR